MKSRLFKILGVVAIVVNMAIMALVNPVAAITGVTLAVGSTTISAATSYYITFTLNATQTGNAAGIVVTFGTGMMVGNPPVTIQTGPGTGSTAMSLTTITADTIIAGQVATINTLNGAVPIGTIGENAIVQLTFSNITNPAAAGNYSISISTAAEPTISVSNTITTTAPDTGALPGVASIYNSAGILITSSNDLAAALAAVQSQTLTGAIIKLTAGTYRSAFPAGTTVACSIQGTDPAAATVILQSTGAWALTGATVTIDKVTIDASAGGFLTMGGGSTTAASVTNSNLKGGALTMAAAGTSATNAITNDTFTVAAGATGLAVKTPTTVANSTFNVAGTGTGITAAANATISGSTFTGTAITGFGVILNGGAASVIGTSTFTGLTTALTVGNAGAGVTFSGNTVTSCGALSKNDTIVITATSGTFIFNNSISNSFNNIINVSGNDSSVVVVLNSFSDNAKAAVDTGGGVLNCTRNYWGGTDNDPVSSMSVSYASPLGAAPTAAGYTTGTSGMTVTAATTVGVNITASSGITTLGAAALASNPVDAALPSNLTLLRYFDVFGLGNSAATATIDFYGTTAAPVTADSVIYFYNSNNTTWYPASNYTVHASAGYVEITIATNAGTTPATAPTPAQFGGLPFALVTNSNTTNNTETTTPAVTTPQTSVTTTVKTTPTSPVTTRTTTTTKTPVTGKPVIPSGLLWAVIAVSAVLVIAVIVLIVRTNRTP